MNKKNFGRVIERIEAEIGLWKQDNYPTKRHDEELKNTGHCGSPYCFLGHAQFIRSEGKTLQTSSYFHDEDKGLAKWLGLTMSEMNYVVNLDRTLADFKQMHRAGKMP